MDVKKPAPGEMVVYVDHDGFWPAMVILPHPDYLLAHLNVFKVGQMNGQRDVPFSPRERCTRHSWHWPKSASDETLPFKG